MTEIETKNAIIEDASIFIEDHGILTAYLYLDYGGSGQGFGGHALHLPKDYTHFTESKNFAGHFIRRSLEIADVEKWAQLKGKAIRVKADHGKVHAIGHILKEDWFNPSYDFKEMK